MLNYHTFLDLIPTWGETLSAFLSAAIPMTVYYVNQTLHKYGDPPWKKQQNSGGSGGGSTSSGGSGGPSGSGKSGKTVGPSRSSHGSSGSGR